MCGLLYNYKAGNSFEKVKFAPPVSTLPSFLPSWNYHIWIKIEQALLDVEQLSKNGASTFNKLAKLGDAIAISKSKTITHSPTD